MIYASWGKKAKMIGYWGILKCSNCKNYSHHDIYEMGNNVKLYFLTVAKYNNKKFLVCPICDSGYELSDETYTQLISKLPSKFTREKTIEIWDKLNTEFVRFLSEIEENSSFEVFFDEIVSVLVDKYGNKENIEEIVSTYLQYTTDEDMPR